jgi:hypothetical protein
LVIQVQNICGNDYVLFCNLSAPALYIAALGDPFILHPPTETVAFSIGKELVIFDIDERSVPSKPICSNIQPLLQSPVLLPGVFIRVRVDMI